MPAQSLRRIISSSFPAIEVAEVATMCGLIATDGSAESREDAPAEAS